MKTPSLLQHLRDLEVLLHQPDIRRDRERLDKLLHEDFAEFGRSGTAYTKAGILERLSTESLQNQVQSDDFALIELTDGVALLTYKSAHIGLDGELCRQTLRASLWQRAGSGWQVRFHQGTPVPEQ